MAKKTVTISRKPSGSGEEAATAGGLNVLPAEMEAPRAAAHASIAAGASAGPGPVGRAVYSTVYCVSYGVVFSALIIGKLIPGSGLIGRAMCDGAGSARHRFDERQEAGASQALEPASA